VLSCYATAYRPWSGYEPSSRNPSNPRYSHRF
jgi:hypothetical protein